MSTAESGVHTPPVSLTEMNFRYDAMVEWAYGALLVGGVVGIAPTVVAHGVPPSAPTPPRNPVDVSPATTALPAVSVAGPSSAPEYVSTAGRTLLRQGGVTVVSVESRRVEASVLDGEEAYEVELASTAEGLLSRVLEALDELVVVE